MALEDDVIKLRDQVTSKKGTTDAAITSFEANELQRLVDEATAAAANRAQALARELTSD